MVIDEALVAVVGPDDSLSALETITVDALRDQPLISLPHGTGVRAALDAACASAGFTPRIIFEASALPMVTQFAALGLGAAVVPASTAQSHRAALHVLQIIRPQIRSRLELVWNPAASASPAARELIEHTRTFMGRLAASPAASG